MALDATIGGYTANSYVTVEEADAYFLDRIHSEDWGVSVPKEQALITASRMLDWYLKFKGYKADAEQAMEWPRVEVTLSSGYEVSSTIIPKAVKVATFEMALAVLAEDRSLDDDLAGLAHVQAGPLVIKTAQGIRPAAKSPVPDRVKESLRDYIRGSGISVVWLERA